MLRPGVYKKGTFSLTEILLKVIETVSTGDSGALATFMGIARNLSKEGKKVAYIEMQSYEEHANRAIERICIEIKSKFNLEYIGIWHLVGRFEVGEPIVLVATSGRRREDTFNGLREAVERYKREPALFKKEAYVDGSYIWVGGA